MRHSHFNTLYRNFTTQAEINAQYTAGASVPYAAACLRHYQPQATRARETCLAYLMALRRDAG